MWEHGLHLPGSEYLPFSGTFENKKWTCHTTEQEMYLKRRTVHEELGPYSVAASLLLLGEVWNMRLLNSIEARHRVRYKFNTITSINS